MPIDISLPMILDEHTEDILCDVHTAVPGIIKSWDAGSQTATVQPAVSKPLRSVDGVQVFEKPPVIQNVPTYVLRGGGYVASVPYAAGDPVWLMFSEQAYSEYLQTGQVSNPKDIRRHGQGYPFAIPGPAPNGKQLTSVSADSMVLGKDGAAQQVVINGSNVLVGADADTPLAFGPPVVQTLTDIGVLCTGITNLCANPPTSIMWAAAAPVLGALTTALQAQLVTLATQINTSIALGQ